MKKLKHVLVAEDDTFLAGLIKAMLSEHKVRVSVVANGKEAIDVITQDQPDLLLLDLLMPEVDGFGVLQHLANNKLRLPVVVITNLGDKPTRDRCKKLGVSAFIVKSDIDDDSLWPVIEGYLK